MLVALIKKTVNVYIVTGRLERISMAGTPIHAFILEMKRQNVAVSIILNVNIIYKEN